MLGQNRAELSRLLSNRGEGTTLSPLKRDEGEALLLTQRDRSPSVPSPRLRGEG